VTEEQAPPTLIEILQAKKAELKARIVSMQTDLAAVEAKIAAIPEEFHHLTMSSVVDKVKAWFES
jgi:prefoldin subunit 5